MLRSKTCAVLAALIFLFVLLSGCTGQASLEVQGVDGSPHFWIPQGCYSTVYGTVKNNSSVTAEEVAVTCTTTQEGEVIDTKTENIGSLSAGSSVNFNMDVDTDCMKGDEIYSCSANCGNCGGAAAGADTSSIIIIIFGIILLVAVAAVIFFSYKKFSPAAGKPKPPVRKAKNPSKCPKCGSKLEAGDKFCIKCGTKI